MNIKVNTKSLLRALVATGKVIAPKALVPARECYLISVTDNFMTVLASDDKMAVRATLMCQGDNGSALIHGKELLDLIKTLPDCEIDIITDDKQAVISWGKGKATLPLSDISEYPQIEAQDDAPSAEFTTALLKTAILHTIDNASDDELRPIMNGIYFDITPFQTTLVASDGHSLCAAPIAEGGEVQPFVLDKKAASYLKDISGDKVTISVGSNNVFITADDLTIAVRKVEGKFPPYQRVIPDGGDKVLTFSRDTLLGSLKRVGVCSDKTTNMVRLNLNMMHSEIVTQDLDFSISAHEDIDAEYDGQDLAIALKTTLLTRALSVMDADHLTLKFTANNRGVLLEGDGTKTVIMPLQLND